MIFDRNENKEVIALLDAGSMGCAIVRRVAAGRKILFGDISEAALDRVSGEGYQRMIDASAAMRVGRYALGA